MAPSVIIRHALPSRVDGRYGVKTVILAKRPNYKVAFFRTKKQLSLNIMVHFSLLSLQTKNLTILNIQEKVMLYLPHNCSLQ